MTAFIQPLVGFDRASETFLYQDRVFRGVYPGHGEMYREILAVLQQHNLFEHGIVATREAPPLDVNPGYDLVLEHERIPFITYPHEWTGSMLKEAALLHIDLYLRLANYDLTLKDWHPYNILFKGASPIFVDFTSVIPMDNLPSQEYLTPPDAEGVLGKFWDKLSLFHYEMHRRMFVPYFLLPLYLMAQQQHGLARTRLFQTTMNASGDVIKVQEALLSRKMQWLYQTLLRSKRLALFQRGHHKTWFFRWLQTEVNQLSVVPRPSGYVDYYKAKSEAFDHEPSPTWGNKQRVCYEVIRRVRPHSVLDIGANTGWFSVLAAKLGSMVVSVDIDESCADAIYREARQEKLMITPLVMDITNPTPDVQAHPSMLSARPQHKGNENPLLLSSIKRLRCDLTLALAIMHHLVLGQGLSFGDIARMLSEVTSDCLILEFIDINDRLISENPTYFPRYNSAPRQFSWYTKDNLIFDLKRYFPHIEEHASYPDTRILLVCRKGNNRD